MATRQNPRFHRTALGNVQYTEQEELERDAEEAADANRIKAEALKLQAIAGATDLKALINSRANALEEAGKPLEAINLRRKYEQD